MKLILKKSNGFLKNASFSSGSSKTKKSENVIFDSNFDADQINKLFSDLTSLNFIELNKLKSEYENLGYSVTNLNIHFHKLASYPVNLTIMTIFGCVIMLNIKRNNSKIFHLILERSAQLQFIMLIISPVC